MKFKDFLKKTWKFIWQDDSWASTLVNFILALVIVKFLIYPLIGLVLGTSFPIVAVVSSSMEHNGMDFNAWWEANEKRHSEFNISKSDFTEFPFMDGFNKGDIMILYGVEQKDIKIGDVVVYENPVYNNPIIHRAVRVKDDKLIMKGDNNAVADNIEVTEKHIKRTGKAVFRFPFLGWIKIWFVDIINLFR